MKEIWKQIPNYKDYEVSTLGKVRSSKFGKIRILKPQMSHRKIPFIRLSENGVWRSFYISSLILSNFVSPRPEGKEASHLNDIAMDNRLSNLAWETPVENRLRAIINSIKKQNFTKKEKINIKTLLKRIRKLL